MKKIKIFYATVFLVVFLRAYFWADFDNHLLLNEREVSIAVVFGLLAPPLSLLGVVSAWIISDSFFASSSIGFFFLATAFSGLSGVVQIFVFEKMTTVISKNLKALVFLLFCLYFISVLVLSLIFMS